MRNLKAPLAALLVLILMLASAVQADDSVERSTELVGNLMTLVRSEFIEDVPPSKLAQGALQGMSEALKEKKLPAPEFPTIPEDADQAAALAVFSEQFGKLAGQHPQLLKDDYLAFEAIKGMLANLGDNYTVFMPPEEYKRLREAMDGGNFGGLGIYIELDKKNEDRLTVVEPIEDTPAFKAGIKPRDVVIKIDGESTQGITIEGAQAKLRGKVGSKVVLTVRRQNQADPFEVAILRDKIHVNSVSHKVVEKDEHKIGYMKLRMFGDKTNDEIEAALHDLEKQGAEAFVLDLRNNGGGYIVASVDVCSKFLPTGSTVVSVQERTARGTHTYRSRPNMRPPAPLVLLVNEYSASASEITAAAMKELERGILIGVKTFGKGSVQKIFPLPDGSALKVTTAHYQTPTGKDINEIGVEPDVVVEMEGQHIGTDKDTQFEKAIDTALEKIGARPVEEVASNDPNAIIVTSVQEELEFLRKLKSPGGNQYQIQERKVVQRDGGLYEQITLVSSDGHKRQLLLDISTYIGQ